VSVKIENTHLEVRFAHLSDDLEKNTAGFFQTADRAERTSLKSGCKVIF
jgi:hypothetical protein